MLFEQPSNLFPLPRYLLVPGAVHPVHEGLRHFIVCRQGTPEEFHIALDVIQTLACGPLATLRYRPVHKSVRIDSAGKSASIRVDVPYMDVSMGFEQQHQNAAEATRRAKELFAVFTSPGT